MAFLYVEIYVARPKDETAPVGVKEYVRQAAPFFSWSSGNETSPALATIRVKAALKSNSHFQNCCPPDDLVDDVVLALYTGTHTASTGTWSTRYGKHIYTWGVGYGLNGQQDAIDNILYYDLA